MSVPGDSDVTFLRDSPSALPGRIGPYHLLQKLGEGGMGEVWVAEQREPIRRTVALKVIKIGMDTHQVVARFEAERQALAVMDHPGIAKVLDAGETEQGRPYFVMEYVKGEPITTFCDRERVSTEDRLALFIRACEGVQHAHQKGIIHRDLKPSNILVTIQDGQPVPKIIDFGIAKATAQQLTQQTVFTELGVLVGTPEYMSPEQAEMGGLDIDTRTDIYSLGVLLYELLTGTLPFESKSLRQKALDEVRRIIREIEPPRPSTRVTGTGPASTEAAKKRLTEPGRLATQLRGDLDWITMKALEKNRTRRYETAAGLANDVRRHLANEPVSAGPPSTAYLAKKFVRRHRFGVAAAAALVLLTVAFATTAGLQARRIAQERDRANREARRATAEAAAAVQVADFLVGLFRAPDPQEARGRDLTAREVLDRGAARIDAELATDPVLQARLLFTMGDVYRNLGVVGRAEQLLARALDVRRRTLGPDAPDTLRAASLLGFVYDLEGRGREAEALLTATLATERRVLGDDHPNTLKTLNRLASVYDSLGRYDEALPLMRDVWERRRRLLGPKHPDTLGSQHNLAIGLYRRGAIDEAGRVLQEAIAAFVEVAGPDHPHTLMSKDLLATVYLNAEKDREAERLLAEVYRARLRALGPDHMDTLATKFGLGRVAARQKRFREAETLLREVLAAQERTLGPDHGDATATRVALATAFSGAGRDTEAERLFQDALVRLRRTSGDGHPDTAHCLIGLAAIEARRGNKDKAVMLVTQAVRVNPVWGPKLADDPAFAALRGVPAFEAIAHASEKK